MNELHLRLNKIRSLGKKADGILLTGNDPGFFYFTNSKANGFFFYDFSKPVLFVSEMERERAEHSWVRNIEVVRNMRDIFSAIDGRVGISKKHMPACVFSGIRKHADITEGLQEAMAIKTHYEIKCIKKACGISRSAFLSVKDNMKNKTEQQVRLEIDYEIMKREAEPAFGTIVATGANTRMPHHDPTCKKISQPVLLDFGARFRGYAADITRTLWSRDNDRIEKITEELEHLLVPGACAKELDAIARKMLGKDEKYFIHSLGHGIGISFDKPHFYRKSRDILKPGMAFAIEVGLYKKQGIRIENDYVIAGSRAVNLTKF